MKRTIEISILLLFLLSIFSCKKDKDIDRVNISDGDGNVYDTITIGTQTWLTENLKTTKYNDGTPIPPVTDANVWSNLTTPGYCWYDNNESAYKATYGALYNWYAINPNSNGNKNICPTGWHVPSNNDFIDLANYLGGINVAGGKMKETGTVHWLAPNTGATNESNFTGLPGGQRNESGVFTDMGLGGVFWSSTPYNSIKPWYRSLYYSNPNLFVGNGCLNIRGFSIRCIKD